MPVTADEYRQALTLFWEQVDEKTSWGKVELSKLWQDCFMAVVTGDIDAKD